MHWKQRIAVKAKEWKLRVIRHPFSALIRLVTFLSVLITMFLFFQVTLSILVQGIPNLSWDLFSFQYTTDNQSLMPSLINTFIITFMSLFFAVPVGIGAAIFLSEYSKRNSVLVKAIRVTAETLAGIPSIIYGLFGMVFFVIALGMGMSLIAGALTLSLMILPLIMRTTEEALLSVPVSYREGSYGLGAGKLRTVFRIVLPPAAPGILAGVVLSIGRIVGETAALIFTAGTVAKLATGISSSGSTLAVHMYMLAGEGHFVGKAYAAASVLLVFVLVMNGLSRLISRRIVKE
ncbi:MAG TPA: phosphate ABC transporter permease PstA [Candidatus Limiplasma sp.]|nr:phosphate ABC transporter permease PstA [Candidatus Limiplasma sp.]HRX08390.1 phosphate ABC transporter permease PstA [Candidatus Limiplasma sp.]